ncbi:hypothetical protein O0I10_003564 [Lichtheimia ornata]|uniref:Kelch repeat protein n=1 Tax=Lichtheimia ornata TaxID=688661 RepID=A0AAD7Y130_9FUNG|nr:uncharacterized protein O0I10_003564 [Lichtheimia ornata]KAJ8660518.1 hypothetical protein O0I10_003564 [Lichtheimia ornata]
MRINKGLLAHAILPAWLITVSAESHPNQYAGGCALVSKKIYCYGGTSTATGFFEYQPNANFYSLDVTGPVRRVENATSWQRVTAVGDTRPTVNMWFGMAALPDQDTFVMTGGVGYANGNALGNPALMYNTTSSSWSAITSQPFEQTQMNTLVADVQRKDRYFIYGGRRDHDTGYTNVSESETYVTIPKFLSTNDLQWSVATEQVVSGRIRHAGVQGKDGRFYFFGGEYSSSQYNETTNYTSYGLTEVDMSQVLIYDETKGWEAVQTTSGSVPSQRWHPTATLLSNGNILVYGGAQTAVRVGDNNYYHLEPVDDTAYVLNTDTMTWSDISSAIQPKEGGDPLDKQQYRRYGHSAVLVGDDSLFIMFGKSTNGSFADGFLILNTTSWVISDYYPGLNAAAGSSDGTDTDDDDDDDAATGGDGGGGLSGGAIAGVVVGVVVGVGLIAGAVAFLFIRRRRDSGQPGESAKEAPLSEWKDSHHDNNGNNSLSDDNSLKGGLAATSPGSPAPPYSPVTTKPDSVPRLTLAPVKPDGA